MALYDVDAPQLGEHAWHAFTADPAIAAESRAHRDRIEEVVARHRPDLDWPRARVLEVGAYRHFTGHMLRAARGCEYVASDLSAAALRDGRAQATREGIAATATLVASDFHDLPLSSGCFDVVFVANSVHHTRRPEVVLSEMLRVLAPNGLLVLFNEPCARLCCFHAFVTNRAESLTPFETRMLEARLLPTLSSPFWGARPEHLFGMVENDRIPLSLYADAFAQGGVMVERSLETHSLVGPLEEALMALASTGDALARDVRAVLRDAVDEARAAFGETERLLGYRLPTECDIHALAARVAVMLERRPRAGDDTEWRAEVFGAAIAAVVRKDSRGSRASTLFRGEMTSDDGVLRAAPAASAPGAGLYSPLLPDIHAAADARSLEPWFPPEDWRFTFDDQGLRTLANLAACGRIELPPREGPTLLLVRYFAVVTEGVPYRLRVWASGRMVAEETIVLQESRLIRAVLPPACPEVLVEVAAEDGAAMDPAWRLRIGVCQLFDLVPGASPKEGGP